ncbi:hypothetical protein F5Y09DRAFT_333918 [Xylaria sp. FL1042]|nr:hypothetical protein F5Y09DRAFT_333918 [Xylaria sp. FL1042]
MQPQSHLQIFTSHDVAPTYIDEFPLFAALPTELRIEIWQLALKHQRIIKIRLRNRSITDDLLARQGAARPSTRVHERYGVFVNGYQTISKLFRVNKESRDVSRAFFRVHLPCWMVRDSTRTDAMKPGILYFNPEHDFLHIGIDTGRVVEFLHDLKNVHDPRNVGLLNLATGINDLTARGGLCTIKPSTLNHRLKTSLTETLLQLRQVFFVQVQFTGRQLFGLGSLGPTDENVINRSFPIETVIPSFSRLSPDPRPIEKYLGKVFVNVDPRRMFIAWRQLLGSFLGVDDVSQTEHRVLLTHGSYREIYNYESAKERLQHEQNTLISETGGSSEDVRGENPEEPVRAAFGFWLFPTTAFGPLPGPDDVFRSEPPRFIDFKGYWPDLALSHLS